ncbi:MAG: hypothetical protein NUW01_14570 [Gemmatimonadaceae bacterium]|nr:hypothetical protein [Gemmatimonadaceae bacterium]
MSKPSPAGRTSAPVRALATGLVDYAGLFPPAQFGMAEAMRNYAGYLSGPHAWMLGRFVVPVARLAELDAISGELLPSGDGSEPWRVAALAGDDLQADIQEALKFNCRHWSGSEIGHAVIDTIELRASPGFDPAAARAAAPDFFTLYVEVAPAGDARPMLDSIQRAGARAKIRMGGVTAEVFPARDDVVAFLAACAERRLAFKATAGLHHAVRSDYPLTYESGSERATMYGFLNVFLAAAALFSGAKADDARGILLESDLSAFQFDAAGITWRDRKLSTEDISAARAFATSFGSCSFREPVDELLASGLI